MGDYTRLNLLELLLASMKGGAKYPYELNYLAGTLANLIDPTKKRTISFDQDQLTTAMIADLKELYSCINVGKSWRGIDPVIAISNPEFDKLNSLVKDTMVEELTKTYPLVGSTLGSLNAPFGGKDEVIVIGNYNLEDLMKLLRQSLYPQLKINYDIPNGFISRALHDLSEAAVRDIGRYFESYGKNYYVARSVSLPDKVITNFYYSPDVVPEEVVKREFMFNCVSTDPQFGNAPFMVKSQLIQGTGTPKVIDINTNKIIGFSDNMEDTRVMQKLFSGKDATFTKNFSDAVTKAYKDGKATMYDEGRVLNFSEMDGSVMVEDPAMGQMTQAAPNPNVPGDMQLQAVQGGAPVATDPNAGMVQPMAPGAANMQPFMDPNTGQPMVDANGQPVMMDPQTGQPMMTDPQSGQLIPAAIDPNTGQVVPVDPNTGMPIAPQPMVQGQPAGMPQVDPNTGQPAIAPMDPSAMQQQPYEFSAAGQQQFSNNTELMNKLFTADDINFNKTFSDAVDKAFETGKSKMFSGGHNGRTFSLGRFVNPKTGIPEVIVQDYSNKGLQLTRVFADTQNNKMRLNSIKIDNNKEMDKRYSDETEVMTRIFSNKDPQFNTEFSRAVLRAYSDGKAHMYSDKAKKEIELTRVYGDVVAEDIETGELTGVTPDENGDLNLVALDNYGEDDSQDGYYNDGQVPYDDIVDNLEDRDAMEPEFYNTIDAGITNEDLAGLEGNPEDSFEGNDNVDECMGGICEDSRDFSIDSALFGKNLKGLKMFADAEIKDFVNVPGEVGNNFEPEAEVKVNPRNAISGETFEGHVKPAADTDPKEIGGNGKAGCKDSREFSDKIDEALGVHMFSEEDVLTDIAEKANEIQSGVEELSETKDKELAEQLQDKVDDLKKELEVFEGDDEVDTEDVKAQCRKYSRFFSDVRNGKYDSLEYKTLNFSKVETPTFAPSSNLLSMLFSGTENEDLIDAAQAEEAQEVAPEEAPMGEYPPVESYPEEEMMPEAAPEEGGNISVSIDPDNTINIDKSFSQTKTFAQSAYTADGASDSLFSNCLTCDLN